MFRYFFRTKVTMKRRNVRTLSLIVVTFTYLLVGAAVFDALEGQHNEDALEALNLMKNNFKLKYNMSEDEYKIIEVGGQSRVMAKLNF